MEGGTNHSSNFTPLPVIVQRKHQYYFFCQQNAVLKSNAFYFHVCLVEGCQYDYQDVHPNKGEKITMSFNLQ